MKTLYFEFADNTYERATVSGEAPYGPMRKMCSANRIWEEANGEVRFIKNRYLDPDTEVDMQEFMWVKLKV